MKKKNMLQLTEGSSYKITSMGARDKPTNTSGKFKGFTVLGNMDALCIELDGTHKSRKGKLRIIPTHMIMTIDIMSAKKAKEDKETEESVFYR